MKIIFNESKLKSCPFCGGEPDVRQKKTVIIERLSKGGYVILGTPQLTHDELNELLGVIYHELNRKGV